MAIDIQRKYLKLQLLCRFLKKIYKNVDRIKIELKYFKTINGVQKNIEEDFEYILCNTGVLKCIPIILAVRKNEIYAFR